MAIPQWTGRQSLAQPNINPTAAIEGASRAFGNISDTLQREQLAKQEEEYRRQQMAVQQEQMGLQQAARLSQDKQFDKQFGLQEQQFLFNKGAGDRATQARIAEEARIRNQNATRYKLFSDKANELENQQLAGFTLHPDTLAALKANNMSDEQIAAVVENTKKKNPNVFLDRNKVLSGLMDHAASTGEDLSNYAPLLSAYQAKNGMGGADPKTIEFTQKLALANARSGGGGSGGSGGGVDPTAGFTAIDNEKLFKDGSDSIFKEVLPGQRHKVYKEDVRRIAEYAHITKGVDPRFVVAAIKADMDDGQTNYTLSKMNTDENDKGYQGILAAAELMQNRAKKGVNSTSSGSGLGSAESALGLSRGYQPATSGQRKDILLDEANRTFPDLFKKATETQSSTGTEQGQTPISEQSVNDPEKRKLIFNLAKEVASASGSGVTMGAMGQPVFRNTSTTPEQKELSSLVKLMEQKPKPNVEMPNTEEFKVFPERWKDPNPAIDAENAKLLREQEKAPEIMYKILSKNKNAEDKLSPLAKWAKETSLAQN